MKLLIQSIAGDMHAGAVAAAMEREGHEILFSVGTDVPERQAYSFRIDEGGYTIDVRRPESLYRLDDGIEVVWSRRARLFQLPALDAQDVAVAEREFRLFLDRLWELAAPRARWVNGWRARELASSKLVQLAAAARCGFAISPTLASHDPEAIVAFAREQGLERLIFKPFGPTGWIEGQSRFATPASRLDGSVLDESDDLRLCPGIYQRFVEKGKELRVTAMGSRLLCVELESDSDVDWRLGQETGLSVRPFVLSEAVAEMCRKLLSLLGLCFGCLDLILDPEGRPYLLEVNEMGQFLWIEQLCPEERYLEAFLGFLLAEVGAKGPGELRLSEVVASPAYDRIMTTVLASP